MELRQYRDVMRRRWRVVVAPVVLVGAVTGGIVLAQPTTYSSTTTLFYSPADLAVAGAGPVGQRLQSYVTLVNSPRVADAVIARLGIPLTVERVRESVRARASAETLLLDVTASDTDAVRSQQLSAAAATELIALATELEGRATPADGTAEPAEAAIPPLAVAQQATPGRSTPLAERLRGVALAALLGLLLGVVLALVRESLDDKVTSPRQLLDDDRLRTLTSIPLDPAGGPTGALLQDRRGPWAEAFRRLRTRLFPAGRPAPKTVLFTGCSTGAATTTVAASLAVTAARAGQRVVVVGADLRHSRLADEMWLKRPAFGLAEVLAERVDLDGALQFRGDGRLCVLPAGEPPANPGELLGSDLMAKTVVALRDRFDLVLIEAAPALKFADAAIISSVAECGVVLVLRYGRTSRDQVLEAVTALEESGVAIHGAVLTMVPGRVRATRPRSRWVWWRRRRSDAVLADLREHVPVPQPVPVPEPEPSGQAEPEPAPSAPESEPPSQSEPEPLRESGS